jgi:hypothetical protein
MFPTLMSMSALIFWVTGHHYTPDNAAKVSALYKAISPNTSKTTAILTNE